MNRTLFRALRTASAVGVDVSKAYRSARGIIPYLRDLHRYTRLNVRPSLQARAPLLNPILDERLQSAGTAGGHYFHQDLWAARKVFERQPKTHVDVGSRIDGFIAHLLVFMPVTVIDIRPLASEVPGLRFIQDDATLLNCFQDNSVDSASSLHAAEHFGLGRYSDPVDPEACFRFMAALARVLKPQGRLYFSVPVSDRERVEFNAHRVFRPSTILREFSKLQLISFSHISDDGSLHVNTDPANIDGEYCCGLFEFSK